MHVDARGINCAQDRLCSGNFRRGAVSHYEKAIGFNRGFVLDHAVLRHANAIERRDKRTYPANDDRILDGGDDNRSDIPKHDNLSDNGNGYEQPAQEQAPEAAPECPARAPELDPIPGIVESDDL